MFDSGFKSQLRQLFQTNLLDFETLTNAPTPKITYTPYIIDNFLIILGATNEKKWIAITGSLVMNPSFLPSFLPSLLPLVIKESSLPFNSVW